MGGTLNHYSWIVGAYFRIGENEFNCRIFVIISSMVKLTGRIPAGHQEYVGTSCLIEGIYKLPEWTDQ